jgi:hypothetical protein
MFHRHALTTVKSSHPTPYNPHPFRTTQAIKEFQRADEVRNGKEQPYGAVEDKKKKSKKASTHEVAEFEVNEEFN